jgi:hypothetical protein
VTKVSGVLRVRWSETLTPSASPLFCFLNKCGPRAEESGAECIAPPTRKSTSSLLSRQTGDRPAPSSGFPASF